MKINFFQLFQKTLRKTLDKETKINYNKENETGHKENTPLQIRFTAVDFSVYRFNGNKHYTTKLNQSQDKGGILFGKAL